MKRIIIKLSLATALLSSSHAIPVSDFAQLFENGQTVVRWGEQLQQWKEEYKRWQKQYDAFTKFKLDGNILNKFTQINDLLAENGLDMLDLDINNPKSELGRMAKQLLGEITYFDTCKYDFLSTEEKEICTDGAVREVQEMVAVKQLTKNVDSVLKKLNDLNKKLETSEDIKTSQDLTSAIESSFATLEILSSKFEMMAMRNKAKKGIDTRKQHQIYMKKFENKDAFVADTYGF